MITLMVIAVDRYFVITRPLSSIGMLSEKRALLVLTFAWVYSLGWSLPPFFGWSEYSKGGIDGTRLLQTRSGSVIKTGFQCNTRE